MSKSGGSSRNSSPRAMPVETIITRFKSAQQKRQLRDMDRTMTKVTELLKNPLKPKVKKKGVLKKEQRSTSMTSLKAEEEKRSKKSKAKNSEKDDTVEEYYPLKLKRHIVLNKVRLKPKYDLKIIAQTNKRKRSIPIKGFLIKDDEEMSLDSDTVSRDVSPIAKRLKPLPQDMSMEEMIQLIEDSGSLNDEDLLEILTCPSPVWWEDPPDGYIEDALFTRPRSSAEMYPSVRTQLQEDLQERQRSSTPNVLSRRERVYRTSINIDAKKTESDMTESNDIDLNIKLNKRDEKFIKKRSKLESVLGNLKNKNVKNDTGSKVDKPIEPIADTNNVSNKDNASNKVSVIKNLCTDKVSKADGKATSAASSLKKDTEKEIQIISSATDSESTDDERLTDLSFHEDVYLKDLENMDIPMQKVSPKKEVVERKKSKGTIPIPNSNKEAKVKGAKVSVLKKADLKKQPANQPVKESGCIVSRCNKSRGKVINFREGSIDPTYSDKESSIIEDYFEMKLFEEDDAVSNKKKDNNTKSKASSVSPPKSNTDYKQKENNLTTSVIKFKNPDNSSINVFKIETVVPKSLPPLKSDRKKNNTGCLSDNPPPLKRNPVIRLNSESPKSVKSITSDTKSLSGRSDNLDSISDTSVCFMNEEDNINDKKYNSNNLNGMNTVIKCNKNVKSNELSLRKLNDSKKDELTAKCDGNSVFIGKKLHLTPTVDLYTNLKQINGVIGTDLEFQSLTITKVKNNKCCKTDEIKPDAVTKKNYVNKVKSDKKVKKTDDVKKTEPKTCVQNELGSLIHNEIGKIGNESSECITVYKIVSDDSGNDEPKNELSPNVKNTKSITKDLQETLDSKEANNCKSEDPTEKSESNRDKMNYYFKKCKNLYRKPKNTDKIDDKIVENKKNDSVLNKSEIVLSPEKKIDKVNNKIDNTGNLDVKKQTADNSKKEVKNKVNHNNNLTSPETKDQKCIIVSNTKQIRYCMKCSSIFDTAQCNYCYRRNSADNKNQGATDYLLKLEQCFICDVCRYKALSKDSLERHISNHCCDSKQR